MASIEVRKADPSEVDALAKVWYDAWQDGHAGVVPAGLTRVRTLASFRDRLAQDLGGLRVVGPPGAPVGLCKIKDDELNQLFVAAAARGSGVAEALLADGERRLAEAGVTTAWLSCAIGNDRAARFYEKHGWIRVGNMVADLETIGGLFRLESWRYEKAVGDGETGRRVEEKTGRRVDG